MRAIKWIGSLVAIVAIISALVFFGNFFSKNSSSSSKTTTSKKETTSSGLTVTSTTDDSDYQTVIQDGTYLTSAARGVTVSANDSTYNATSFQSGLLSFSKGHFSPKTYIFQEGQYLTSATAQKWLARKSDQNTLGLNPTDNGKYDADRNPMYVQTIEEQDFMTQKGSDLNLSGIVIGIGMNTEDIYQKETYGASYTQKISKADRIAYGRKVATEIVKRYRAMDKIDNTIPIVVAMYEEASTDSLVGGTFYSWAESKSGDTLSNWTDLNYTNVVLPMQDTKDNKTSVAATLNTSFKSFEDKIENFFPTLSSVTGQARYKDSTLTGLNVTLTTQFYSETEIENFANYVATQAPNYLPKNVKIQIRIESSVGMQAILVKSANTSKYQVIILGSY